MDVVWSREFLIALLSFVTPTALAALLVYRRMVKSDLVRRRMRVKMTEATVRRALQASEPPRAPAVVVEPVVAAAPAMAPAAAAVASGQSLQQSLENLRRVLMDFRSSIQHSRSALEDLRERDCQFSQDLGRASEVMQHAFSK